MRQHRTEPDDENQFTATNMDVAYNLMAAAAAGLPHAEKGRPGQRDEPPSETADLPELNETADGR